MLSTDYIKKPARKRFTMKTQLLLIVAILATAALPIAAQSDRAPQLPDAILGSATADKLESAKKNYLLGLSSENDGVVESSLYFAVRMRLVYPDLEMEQISEEVDRLADEGNTSSIRYKAHIASTIFSSPSLVNVPQSCTAPDIPSFFISLSTQLQQQLLVQKR
ncbi:MAG: hypothetical protein C0600_02495 [Ignavibacteria bacterium]|nr:MAG: hypothetical protein C0600_02495 [Ignavibacteria bacterium]